MGVSSSTGNDGGEVICDICGIRLNTKDEKEEHMKLEHREHKLPSGVG